MVTQARAHATRESIVRGAGQVFSDASYSSAKLGDVIAAAGVTQGALYFHFDSKRDLALEVIRRQHAASVDAATEQMKKPEPGWKASYGCPRCLLSRSRRTRWSAADCG